MMQNNLTDLSNFYCNIGKKLSPYLFQILPYVNGTLYSLLSSTRILNQAKDIGLQERLIQAANKTDCDEESKRQIAYLLEQFDKISDSNEFGAESECSEITDGSESPSDDGYQGGDDEEDDTIVSPINLKRIFRTFDI